MCALTSGPANHRNELDALDLEAQSHRNHLNPTQTSRHFFVSSPLILVPPPTLLPVPLSNHHATDSLLSRNREFPQLLVNQALHVGRPDSPPLRTGTTVNNLHLRYLRLIGNSNPRYEWARYLKTEEELKTITHKKV